MRRSASGRFSLLLVVLLVSAVFGVAQMLDDMRSSSAVIPLPVTPPATPVILPTTVEDGLTVPGATPEPPRYQLSIPALGVSARIVHLAVDGVSWNVTALGNNAGHLLGTSWFEDADPRNIVMAGHVELRDGTQGIFAQLSTLPIGETIVIHSDDTTRRYRIEESYETVPSDLTPLYSTAEETITLITCSDYDFLGNEYLSRHIVVARAVDLQ